MDGPSCQIGGGRQISYLKFGEKIPIGKNIVECKDSNCAGMPHLPWNKCTPTSHLASRLGTLFSSHPEINCGCVHMQKVWKATIFWLCY